MWTVRNNWIRSQKWEWDFNQKQTSYQHQHSARTFRWHCTCVHLPTSKWYTFLPFLADWFWPYWRFRWYFATDNHVNWQRNAAQQRRIAQAFYSISSFRNDVWKQWQKYREFFFKTINWFSFHSFISFSSSSSSTNGTFFSALHRAHFHAVHGFWN